MNKYILTIIASMSFTIACGGDEFTTSSTGPKEPVPNDLTGTICDPDNADSVDCSGQDECSGVQFCEAGEWGLCDCTQSGESGGSSTGGTGTGGEGSGNSGGMPSGGASGGETSTGGDTSTGGNGVCVPETCEEHALRVSNGDTQMSCGEFIGNCGQVMNCGGCDVLGSSCTSQNICFGKCEYFEEDFDVCLEHPDKKLVTCDNYVDQMPQSNGCSPTSGNTPEIDWCCENTNGFPQGD